MQCAATIACETTCSGACTDWALMLVVIFLLLYQPDLGSTIVITLTVATVLFLAG